MTFAKEDLLTNMECHLHHIPLTLPKALKIPEVQLPVAQVNIQIAGT